MKKLSISTLFLLVSFNFFSQTFTPQRLDSLFQVLEKKDKFMGSIAVSQNGKLLYANAIGYADCETSKKATSATKYRIGSISKMFTAILVLKAIEEHKLSLNQTLYSYFPQIKNSKKITLANLLQHRSGIYDFTHSKDYLTYNTEPKSEKDMIEIIAKGKSNFDPNSKGEYCNSNYVVLSYILEKAYKKDYTTILTTKIIKPLGLQNTYFGGKTNPQNNESYSYKFDDKWTKTTETDSSVPMGAGAIVSNPTDLSFFIEQLFAGKLISDKSLALMKTINQNFGMGMFEFSYLDTKSYGHTGGIDGFKSVLEYFPKEKITIALLSNGSTYTLHDVMTCAKSSCFNEPFEIPTFENKPVDFETLNSYVGNYTCQQLPFAIVITKNQDQLFAEATGQSSLPLDATSATVFKFEKAGIVLEFNNSKKEMTLKQGGKEFLFTKE